MREEMPDEEATSGLPGGRRRTRGVRHRPLAGEPGERREARNGPEGAASEPRPEAIVAGAVAIIDADGLDALTVRRLASELGVAPMTVYSYVRGKEEILDLAGRSCRRRTSSAPTGRGGLGVNEPAHSGTACAWCSSPIPTRRV